MKSLNIFDPHVRRLLSAALSNYHMFANPIAPTKDTTRVIQAAER